MTPTYMGIGSPTGRSTRTFKALSVTTKKLVFLKDTWRVIHPGILPEHEIYAMLASHRISHVATLIAYHDMVHQATRTKDFAREEWVQFNGFQLFRKFQHYRLVLKEVGHPVESFRNVRELIQVFRDALHAHRLAHDMAIILHRDISPGNIMITEDRRGLLVDWDLSKSLVNVSGAMSPPERTGTWQFMAARLIVEREPGTPPPVPDRLDDLESFWHVLLWIILRHCDHRMNHMKIVDILSSLFDHKYIGATGQAQGSENKINELGFQSHISSMHLGSNILRVVLRDTARVLADRYPCDPEIEKGYLEVKRMWEKLELENTDLNKILETELRQRIALMDDGQLTCSYVSWRNWFRVEDAARMEQADEGVLQVQQMWQTLQSGYSQFRLRDILLQQLARYAFQARLSAAHELWTNRRTMEDDVDWMEKIFDKALQDPTVDWNTGCGNIQRVLLGPSAPKPSKRQSESDIDGRKPKKTLQSGVLA